MKHTKKCTVIIASLAIIIMSSIPVMASFWESECPDCGNLSVMYDVEDTRSYSASVVPCSHHARGTDVLMACEKELRFTCGDCFCSWYRWVYDGAYWECEGYD